MKAKIVSVLSSVGALIWGCIGGSCGIACLAGGCCGGTALLGFLSLSSSSLRFLEKLTPVFLTLTIVSLGYAFYKAYKPIPASCCSEKNSSLSSDCCEKEKAFLKSKPFLWITTIICAIMWIYPYVFTNGIKNQTNTACCSSSNINDSLIGPKTIKIQANFCCPK